MLRKLKFFDFKSTYKPSKLNIGTWIEWLLLGLVFIISFFIFMYVDITNTIDNSVLFTKALFSGNILDFYEFTIDNANTTYAANYEMVAYIPFAIWNLPIAVCNMLFDFDYMHSTAALLWGKAFIVLLSVLTVLVFYKILIFLKVQKEKAVLGCYALTTSVFFFWPAIMIVQIDLVAVLLMLIGFCHYLKGNSKLFILFFALAVPCKLFALFLFIPLLVLKEKRIIFIILKTVLVYSVQLFSSLLYHNSPAYNFAIKSQSRDAMDAMLNYSQILGGRKVSLFIAALFFICVFCYVYKLDKKDSAHKLNVPVYIASLVWGAVMIFIQIRGYWTLYLAPFLLISIFTTERFFKLNLLLETVSGVSFFFWYAAANGGAASDKKMLWRLLLYKFVDKPNDAILKYGNLSELLKFYGLDQYKYVFFTVFVCSLAALLILICPFLFKKHKDCSLIERSVVLIRPIALIVMVILYIFAATKTINPVLYNSIDRNSNVSCNYNLLESNELSQEFNLNSDYELNTLTLVFNNSSSSRHNFCSVDIKINDLSENKNIFSKRIGCSLIENKKEINVSLGGISVTSKDKYEIVLSAQLGIDENVAGYTYFISPYVTDKNVDPEYPAKINGVKQDYNLAYKLR